MKKGVVESPCVFLCCLVSPPLVSCPLLSSPLFLLCLLSESLSANSDRKAVIAIQKDPLLSSRGRKVVFTLLSLLFVSPKRGFSCPCPPSPTFSIFLLKSCLPLHACCVQNCAKSYFWGTPDVYECLLHFSSYICLFISRWTFWQVES